MLIWSERRAWFEQGNVESGVNLIPVWGGGVVELVCDLIDLPLDRERTNIAVTQLLAGQAESQD